MTAKDQSERIAELEADNRRLRRLLDQRDAPGELRHRLRSTTALLRGIIRKSARSKRDLEDYVAHLEDRLDAVMRAQTTADVQGNIALRTVIEDELRHYGVVEEETSRVRLHGPPVYFRARAGQMFALAVHELAVNSVEHGTIGEGDGRLDIVWVLAEEAPRRMLSFVWKETFGEGRPTPEARREPGFGTAFLTEALAYELKARTSLAMEADGLRCTIRFPLTDRIGEMGPARLS